MCDKSVYFYIFRSYVPSSDLLDLQGESKCSTTDDEAFVIEMKHFLYEKLKIFSSPVDWHSRWHLDCCQEGSRHLSCCQEGAIIRNITLPRPSSFKVENVYFDFECWNQRNEGYHTIGAAIANSIVFVAHISVDSIKQLAAITPSLGRDWVSPFLLQLTIALFLFYTRQGSVRAILPVVSNDLSQQSTSANCSNYHPYAPLSAICDEPSQMTSTLALQILNGLGFVTDTDVGGAVLRGSVRETVMLILGSNEKARVPAGIRTISSFFEAPGGREPQPILAGRGDGAAAAAADQVEGVLRAALRCACEERMWELEKYSATAAELMRWLDAAGLQAYKIPCAVAGVDSLHRLTHPRALPLIAWAADGIELPGVDIPRPPAAVGNKGVEDLSARNGLRPEPAAVGVESLAVAAAELAQDHRARPLFRRVEDFRDRQANGLVALMTPNAIETGILSAQTQACAAAMGIAQLLLGSYMLHFVLNPDTRCVQQANDSGPFVPRVQRAYRITAPAVAMVWGLLWFGMPLVAHLSSPRNSRFESPPGTPFSPPHETQITSPSK